MPRVENLAHIPVHYHKMISISKHILWAKAWLHHLRLKSNYRNRHITVAFFILITMDSVWEKMCKGRHWLVICLRIVCFKCQGWQSIYIIYTSVRLFIEVSGKPVPDPAPTHCFQKFTVSLGVRVFLWSFQRLAMGDKLGVKPVQSISRPQIVLQ